MKPKIDTAQMSIFDIAQMAAEAASTLPAALPGSLAIDPVVRELISLSLKNATHLSRYQVAAKMSELLGRDITKAQLDSWSAESKEGNRFPLNYTPAFVKATGDTALVEYIARQCGGCFIRMSDTVRLELGRIEEEQNRLEQRKHALNDILTQTKGDKNENQKP